MPIERRFTATEAAQAAKAALDNATTLLMREILRRRETVALGLLRRVMPNLDALAADGVGAVAAEMNRLGVELTHLVPLGYSPFQQERDGEIRPALTMTQHGIEIARRSCP